MAHPQVAGGGTGSDMEGSYEYIEYAVEDSRQGLVQLWGWARWLQLLTTETYESFTNASEQALVNAVMNLRVP